MGKLEREVAAAALADVKQRVAVEVGSALARVQMAQERLEIERTRTRLMDDFATLAERQFQAGDIGTADLQLARVALAGAQLELTSAEAVVVDARRAATEASGRDLASWPPLPEQLPPAPAPFADLDSLLTRLPALRELGAEAEAARAGIVLAQRQRRPDPTLALRGGQEGADTLVAVNVSSPLFVRNTFRAEVDAASSASVNREKLLLDAFLRARARHTAAAETYAALYAALERWRAGGLVALGQRLETLQRLWQARELSAAEYLVQTRESLNAELSGIEVKRRAWEAWFEWLDAAGEVNDWLGISAEETAR